MTHDLNHDLTFYCTHNQMCVPQYKVNVVLGIYNFAYNQELTFQIQFETHHNIEGITITANKAFPKEETIQGWKLYEEIQYPKIYLTQILKLYIPIDISHNSSYNEELTFQIQFETHHEIEGITITANKAFMKQLHWGIEFCANSTHSVQILDLNRHESLRSRFNDFRYQKIVSNVSN